MSQLNAYCRYIVDVDDVYFPYASEYGKIGKQRQKTMIRRNSYFKA